jgi:hypothetical protein
MKNKLCPRCNIEKGITAFSKDKTKLDGLESCCKSCKKGSRNLEKNREFYHKNKKYYQEYRNKSQKFVQLCKQTLGCFYCTDMDDVCLDFHHVEFKKYDITKVNSIDAIIKEMSNEISNDVEVEVYYYSISEALLSTQRLNYVNLNIVHCIFFIICKIVMSN